MSVKHLLVARKISLRTYSSIICPEIHIRKSFLKRFSFIPITKEFSSLLAKPSIDEPISPSTQIIQQCLQVRQSIQDLNDRVKGPLEKSSQKNTALPFVFLLGAKLIVNIDTVYDTTILCNPVIFMPFISSCGLYR